MSRFESLSAWYHNVPKLRRLSDNCAVEDRIAKKVHELHAKVSR